MTERFQPQERQFKMYKRIADKITKFVLATLKKETLMDMALNGKARPKKNKRLARALSKYAGPTTHDPKFSKEIRRLRPHWFGEVSPLENVIQRMLAAKSPAHKAHATRALNNYSRKRAAEIGSTPERVMAGVKAAVTKRRGS